MYKFVTKQPLTQAYLMAYHRLSTFGTKPARFLIRNTTNAKREKLLEKYSVPNLSLCMGIYRSTSSMAQSASLSPEDVADFMSVFPEVVQELTQDAKEAGLTTVVDRLSTVLEYNVFGGKQTICRLFLVAYKAIAAPEELTKENLRRVHILMWCCELGFASFLMLDDIMDESEMRRGKPCWYRNEKIGLTAITDSLLLRQALFLLLRRHFHQEPQYSTFAHYFQNVSFKACIGQCVDLQCARGGKPQLGLFTRLRYDNIIKYKTAAFMYLPVGLVFLLTGVHDVEMRTRTKNLMLEIGKWYQVQDDFLDYAGKSEVIGKDVGNDIKDGKCTWLAVTALELASPQERDIMERCYGSPDPKDIQTIRDLYADLEIPQLFRVYEEEVYNRVRSQINQYFTGKPQEMLFLLVKKLHKRQR